MYCSKESGLLRRSQFSRKFNFFVVNFKGIQRMAAVVLPKFQVAIQQGRPTINSLEKLADSLTIGGVKASPLFNAPIGAMNTDMTTIHCAAVSISENAFLLSPTQASPTGPARTVVTCCLKRQANKITKY